VSEPEGYSARVRELFAAAPRAGAMPAGEGAVIVGEAEALERGAWVRLEARVVDGVVVMARFRAWGCPHVLAACALAAERLEGRAPGQAPDLTAAALATALDAPAGKLGRLLVVEDAVTALAAAAPGRV